MFGGNAARIGAAATLRQRTCSDTFAQVDKRRSIDN